jgi:hypothetical protein
MSRPRRSRSFCENGWSDSIIEPVKSMLAGSSQLPFGV